MTLTLTGDIVISFFLTLAADRIGRKTTLAAGAILMSLSGVVFALFDNYWILLAAAVFGVISPSGNEIGPFRAVEESIVAHLTPAERRSDVYAWYSLVGTAGTAFGMMACGWGTHGLVEAGWDVKDAYRMVFWGYAVLGAVKLLFTLGLSRAVEAESSHETEPLLSGETREEGAKKKMSLMPHVSAESRGIAVTLCLLFGLDAFASGLAPLYVHSPPPKYKPTMKKWLMSVDPG